MKNFIYILLIAPLFFISSCEEESENGYDCISNTCTAVFESPQYLTLYDCQSACEDNNGGNSNLEIGAIYQGGIIFYIDETGEHGLVAAMEDIEGTYEWGCYGTDINGNNSSVSPELDGIGTGLQNTLEIVSGCSETPIAASEALAYESGGYSDWYLPSKDELIEMYNTIGNDGLEGNIGGFENNWYWSSSENNSNDAWDVYFDYGYTLSSSKSNTNRVRVIRAF